MALTITSNEWERTVGVGHNLSIQAALNARKLKMYKIKVTFGASDNYVTNGVAADLKKRGAKSIVAAICTSTTIGVIVNYDVVNEKIQMFGTDPAAGGGAITALPEVVNADTSTQSAVFDFLVFAQ